MQEKNRIGEIYTKEAERLSYKGALVRAEEKDVAWV